MLASEVSNLFGEIFLVMTPEGDLLRWNDRLGKTSGFEESEIASKQWTDLIAAKQRVRAQELLQQVVMEGAARASIALLTEDGEIIPCEFRGRIRQQDDRQLIYVRVTCEEVSAGEMTGTSIPAHFREVLSQLPVYVFTQDRNLHYTSMCNPAPGRTLEGAFGHSHLDLFRDQTRHLDELKKHLLSTGEPKRVTNAVELEGKRHYFDTYLAPRYDRAGNIQGLVGASVDVTEQRKAEEALRESEEMFRALAENAPIGIAWSQEGVNRYVNRAFADIVGYDQEELIDRSPEAVFHPDDWPVVQEQIRRRLEGETNRVHYRVRMQTRSGETRQVEIDATCIQYQDKPTLVGTIRDITEQVRMQEELRERERKYRRLFEESQEGITVTSPDGTIVDANPATCALNGYSRNELIGMQTVELYVYPEEREKARRLLEEKDHFRNLEIHVRRKDGEVITCQASASVIRDGGGNIQAFQSYARDVTEQKEARRALEESERKFRELAEQSIMGIALVQDQTYRYVNPRLAELLKYETDEIIDKKGPKDFVHPADWPRIRENINRCLSGEDSSIYHQARGVRKDGKIVELEVYGTRIQSAGRPAVLVYLIDVTEQRQLQRDILQIQEEERQRIGQDLHDGVASQLTGVTMLLSSIIRDAEDQCLPLAEELEQIKSLVNESGEDVRRISRGLSPVNLAQGDLPAALERLARTVNTTEGLSCDLQVDGELPDNTEEIATHLYWIAQEAVTNARKYASAESIRIRLFRQGSDLTLSVTDDGKGFEVSKVGEEGLGQRTMRYRAEILDGRLSIDTVPGRGTTVRVRVPLE